MNPNIELGLPSLTEYYMMQAYMIKSRANCLNRAVGAILTSNDNRSILATGYNAVPMNLPLCVTCRRREEGYGTGEGLDRSRASHAEANVIVQAARFGRDTDGSILYVTTQPCSECAKLIINAGIMKIYYCDPYPGSESIDMFNEVGIEVEQMDKTAIIKKIQDYAAVLT